MMKIFQSNHPKTLRFDCEEIHLSCIRVDKNIIFTVTDYVDYVRCLSFNRSWLEQSSQVFFALTSAPDVEVLGLKSRIKLFPLLVSHGCKERNGWMLFVCFLCV